MRRFAFALATVLGLIATSGAQAAVTLNFSASQGSEISFVGNGTSATFNLTPNSTPQFSVTSTSGGNGSGLGITGSILSAAGFTYQKAGITTSGPVQSAALTGTGTLTLVAPGGGETVTASIAGVDIETDGTNGGTNTTGIVNLTSLTLSGSGNADLTAFYNQALANGGIAALDFTFIPAQSLTAMTAVGTHSTSYSGVITSAAVPEPATLASALLGVALIGGGAWLRRPRTATTS